MKSVKHITFGSWSTPGLSPWTPTVYIFTNELPEVVHDVSCPDRDLVGGTRFNMQMIALFMHKKVTQQSYQVWKNC